MKKINIIQRFVKTLTDFKFANHFLKEKTGKAIGYMLTCYLVFALTLGLVGLVVIGPIVNNTVKAMTQALETMPDFQVQEGQLNAFGTTYGVYGNEDIQVILDLENDNMPGTFSEDQYVYVFRKDGLYTNDVLLLQFDMLENLDKAIMLDYVKMFDTMFYVAIGLVAALGTLAVFFVSSLAWALVIIINGFMRKDITTGDCYKIGIYAMTAPGLVLLITWVLSINIPRFSLVYIGILGFYAYQYIKQYDPDQVTFEEIYE